MLLVTSSIVIAMAIAIAASDDPFGLYDERMTLCIWTGIASEGMPGSYTYRLDEPTDELRPVNFVEFWDVLR